MKQKKTAVRQAKPYILLRYGIYACLLLVPLHAPQTVWLASLGIDYDIVRLWKEFLLLILLGISAWILIVDRNLRQRFFGDRLMQLIIVFVGLAVLSAVASLVFGSITPKSIAFGLIIDTRMLVFLLVVTIALWSRLILPVPGLIIIPAIIVIGFGLLQMSVLPADFLGHFGYGEQTIKAFQAVDNNPDFPRVQSTLRGPNPLGAYLIPVGLLLTSAAIKFRRYRAQFLTGLVACMTVLFGTYSRSAWLGATLAIGLMVGLYVKGRFRTMAIVSAVLLLIVSGLSVYIGRDNDFIQNVVFHSSEASRSHSSSNEQRANALRTSLKSVGSDLLGGGIGSAGPASVYNQGGTRIAENFYIQIGQELGIIGLTLYLGITFLILKRLWEIRVKLIAQVTLAAFMGLILVNMVSHAWSDDTIAYVFGALLAYALTAYKVSTKSE